MVNLEKATSDFKNIKVGDKIIVKNFNQNSVKVLTVTRLTKTQFISNDLKFSKKNGKFLGGLSRGYIYAYNATDELIEKIEIYNTKINVLNNFTMFISKINAREDALNISEESYEMMIGLYIKFKKECGFD